MPGWEWILVAAVVVVVVVTALVVASVTSSRRQTTRLKQHYGREYERVLSETGSQKAAEKELTARERKHDSLDIVPLTRAAYSDFATRWSDVQTRFVDDPAAAVGVADRLITQVMRERGYPVDDFDQRAADISVDHPQIVEEYRAAHGIHITQRNGGVSTEQQREAFVHYRALFDQLLETNSSNDAA